MGRENKKKKRIAFINQRYGREVNGGSESYTMQMAQHLKAEYEVEVLTSKALTYDKWEDYYEATAVRCQKKEKQICAATA